VRGEIRIDPSFIVKVNEDVEKLPPTSVRSTEKFKYASFFIFNGKFPSGPTAKLSFKKKEAELDCVRKKYHTKSPNPLT
jgi:hypothetical protein